MVAAKWLIICVELLFCTCLYAATHWIVTSDGKIDIQMPSPYNMRRPYDLISAMKQEQRVTTMRNIKAELSRHKQALEETDDEELKLENTFYKTNSHCIAAGKPLVEFDLYISTVLPLENKGIKPEEHIDLTIPMTAWPTVPDCTAIGVPLPFSIYAFEHLEGVQLRRNLTTVPEAGLKNAVIHRENVDDYGHLVSVALKKNRTSWVLYNMAAFFWRMKGEPYQAIECLRRALHFSPRQHQDVALVSLANILHHASYSHEAKIVALTALDISKELNVNHFTLGNIYAALGDFRSSAKYFKNTLLNQPDFEAAKRRLEAVLCHDQLEKALEAQHRSLQQTLHRLEHYQHQRADLNLQQQLLQSENAPPAVVQYHQEYYNRVLQLEEDMRQGYGIVCHVSKTKSWFCKWKQRMQTLNMQIYREAKNMGICPWQVIKQITYDPPPVMFPLLPAPVLNDDPVLNHIALAAGVRYLEDSKPTLPADLRSWPHENLCPRHCFNIPGDLQKAFVQIGDDDTTGWHNPVLLERAKKYFTFPKQLHVNDFKAPSSVLSKKVQGLLKKDRPKFEWCQKNYKAYNFEDFISTWIHVEFKGEDAWEYVDFYSSPEGNHRPYCHMEWLQSTLPFDDIPWLYEPGISHLMYQPEAGLMKTFLSLSKNGEKLHQIATRIYYGLEKRPSSWVLNNLAALYWRVVGNARHAIRCSRLAYAHAPTYAKDISLLSLANVLQQSRHYKPALHLAMLANAASPRVPATQFTLSTLCVIMGEKQCARDNLRYIVSFFPALSYSFEALRSLECAYILSKPKIFMKKKPNKS